MNNDRKNGNEFRQLHDCRHDGAHHGPSSFYKHDSPLAFETLELHRGDTFLDLGCGAGDYSLCAAKIVGETGRVFALDVQQKFVDTVCKNAQAQGIHNVYPVVSDLRQRIDLPNDLIDVCLLATVLHTVRFPQGKENLYSEIRRVIKPDGKLAIIECKKEMRRHGPPLKVRVSPEEIENDLKPYGFFKTAYADLGPNYLVLFSLDKSV